VLTRAALRKYAESRRVEFERLLQQLVEIPSVSTDPERRGDVERAAEAAAAMIRGFGGTVRVHRAGPAPLVVGALQAGRGLPTVTLYNHLDVQPADREAEGWRTEPFKFVRKGERYFGRGTTDDKGPALAALFGAAAAREAGVPVNVRFLWELEEEIGSPHFEGALAQLAPRLTSDVVVVSDASWLARDRPACTAALRGNVGFRFVLETAEGDAHSGDVGGAARNPLAELMDLMSAIHDAQTGRVKVPGFYDDVVKPTHRELQDFERSGFRVATFKKDNRLKRLRTEDPLAIMERIWARPTFEVNGVVGGYSGPGLKSIVPGRAEVKASCRLVPRQRPETVSALIAAFARRHNRDVVVHREGGALPCQGVSTGPVAEAIKRAIAFGFGKEPVFVRDGGTIGAVVTMQKVLRAPVAFLNLSLPEHGYHAPNENFDWGQAGGGIAAFAQLLAELSSVAAKRD
jgi:acetylornithine deacetylase/succinyl-diaminopimelate desuccinylase-like protein